MILSPEVEQELRRALEANEGKLGMAYALIRDGKGSSRELIDGGAAANHGAAHNLRRCVTAIIEGRLPKSPSVSQNVSRSIGGLLRDNPELSGSARDYLLSLRVQLEAIIDSADAIEKEDAELKQASNKLEKSLDDLPGVYVYTLPALRRSVIKTDPDRYWFKVGKTNRVAGVRIGEQMRSTGLPEDPWLARVYRHNTISNDDLEKKFHKGLADVGHAQATGRHTGKEWYATNLEALDGIANLLGCDIASSEPEDD